MRVGLPPKTPKAALDGPGKAKAASCPSVRRTSDSRRAAIMDVYSAPMKNPSTLNERPTPNGSFRSTLAFQLWSVWRPAITGENPASPNDAGAPRSGAES